MKMSVSFSLLCNDTSKAASRQLFLSCVFLAHSGELKNLLCFPTDAKTKALVGGLLSEGSKPKQQR